MWIDVSINYGCVVYYDGEYSMGLCGWYEGGGGGLERIYPISNCNQIFILIQITVNLSISRFVCTFCEISYCGVNIICKILHIYQCRSGSIVYLCSEPI